MGSKKPQEEKDTAFLTDGSSLLVGLMDESIIENTRVFQAAVATNKAVVDEVNQ